MKIIPSNKYKTLFQGNKRYYICIGGRSGGRSHSASQYALLKMLSADYFRCAMMRYVLGDIRNSIAQDIGDRIFEYGLENTVAIKDLHFEYGENKINGIGFKKSSGDQKSKLKSLASYNCVIIEEADETNEEDFMQLDDSLRTKKGDIIVILLLNPPDKNHWIIRRWFNLIESGVDGFYKLELKDSVKHNTEFIFTTWRDNKENINQTTIDNFMRYKETNPDYYWNMIEGLVSDGARGRIYKNWITLTDKEFEELDYPVFYGLDFGFSNDPTALVELKEHNGIIYARELIYETGLLNKHISDKMTQLGVSKSAVIYADSQESKSIAELRTLGWNVKPAVKGQGSVRAGITYVLERQVIYTESSTNLAKESQSYVWALSREKEPTNEPVDKNNHLMDALRYGVYSKSKERFVGFV